MKLPLMRHPGMSLARLFLGLVVLGAGVGLLWRGLGNSRPPAAQRSSRAVHGVVSASDAKPPYHVDAIELTDDVSEESLPEVLDAIGARARAESESLGLSPARADALADEAQAFFEYVLLGSMEKRDEFIASRGGVPVGPEIDPERARAARAFSGKVLASYRMQPVSIGGMLVRQRAPAEGSRSLAPRETESHLSGRYPLLQSVIEKGEDGSYTVTGESYEVVLPVRQIYDGRSVDVLVGVWLTWVPEIRRWLPSKVSMYGGGEVMIAPPL